MGMVVCPDCYETALKARQKRQEQAKQAEGVV